MVNVTASAPPTLLTRFRGNCVCPDWRAGRPSLPAPPKKVAHYFFCVQGPVGCREANAGEGTRKNLQPTGRASLYGLGIEALWDQCPSSCRLYRHFVTYLSVHLRPYSGRVGDEFRVYGPRSLPNEKGRIVPPRPFVIYESKLQLLAHPIPSPAHHNKS